MKKMRFSNADILNKDLGELDAMYDNELGLMIETLKIVSPESFEKFHKNMFHYEGFNYILFEYVRVTFDYDKKVKELKDLIVKVFV